MEEGLKNIPVKVLYFLSKNFFLEYSWLIMCYFQVCSKVIQIYIYPFFFRFFSHIGHYTVLSRASCNSSISDIGVYIDQLLPLYLVYSVLSIFYCRAKWPSHTHTYIMCVFLYTHVSIYILFLTLSSIMLHHNLPDRVPSAIQKDLIAYP